MFWGCGWSKRHQRDKPHSSYNYKWIIYSTNTTSDGQREHNIHLSLLLHATQWCGFFPNDRSKYNQNSTHNCISQMNGGRLPNKTTYLYFQLLDVLASCLMFWLQGQRYGIKNWMLFRREWTRLGKTAKTISCFQTFWVLENLKTRFDTDQIKGCNWHRSSNLLVNFWLCTVVTLSKPIKGKIFVYCSLIREIFHSYLAALTGMDAVVKPWSFVPTHSTLDV